MSSPLRTIYVRGTQKRLALFEREQTEFSARKKEQILLLQMSVLIY